MQKGLWKSKGAAKQVKSHRHHAVIAACYRPQLLHDWIIKDKNGGMSLKGKGFNAGISYSIALMVACVEIHQRFYEITELE